MNNMAQETKTGYATEKVDTLVCQTYIPEDGTNIDHIAITDNHSTIIVGRYEILELIEYLQRIYEIGK